MERPTIDDLHGLQIRAGTVVRAEVHDSARDPAYRLWIDFGPLGEKQSSAQITDRYTPEGLVGRQVIAVAGFEPRPDEARGHQIDRLGGAADEHHLLGALGAAAKLSGGLVRW